MDHRLSEFDFGSNSLEAIEERPDLLIWQATHRGTARSESLGEFMVRVTDSCEEMIERHKNECVAVFAHAGTIDAAIRWAVGFTPESIWQHEFNLTNGSITEIDYWPNGQIQGGSPRYASIVRVGDSAHLTDLVSII